MHITRRIDSETLTTIVQIVDDKPILQAIRECYVNPIATSDYLYEPSPSILKSFFQKLSYIYVYYPEYIDEICSILDIDYGHCVCGNVISKIFRYFLYVPMTYQEVLNLLLNPKSYIVGVHSLMYCTEFSYYNRTDRGLITTDWGKSYIADILIYEQLLKERIPAFILNDLFYTNNHALTTPEKQKKFRKAVKDLVTTEQIKEFNQKYVITRKGLYKRRGAMSELLCAITSIEYPKKLEGICLD